MPRASYRLPAALFALSFAACGTAGDGVSTADRGAAPAKAKSSGAMKVTAVDGRVGDATAATSTGGVISLKVRRRPVDPKADRFGVGAGASCPDVDVLPSAENLAVVAEATICLVNGERADAGLPALTGHARLDQSSLSHSQDMVAHSYFSHQGLDGRSVTDRIRATGYIPTRGEWTVGENLAWGTSTLATPLSIVQAWMNSQGHRENILRSSFREAGLGIALGNPQAPDGEGATYTMNFGSTGGTSAQTVAATLIAGAQAQAPRLSDVTRRAAARRVAARKRKSCRTKGAKVRVASVKARQARIRRCTRRARARARARARSASRR